MAKIVLVDVGHTRPGVIENDIMGVYGSDVELKNGMESFKIITVDIEGMVDSLVLKLVRSELSLNAVPVKDVYYSSGAGWGLYVDENLKRAWRDGGTWRFLNTKPKMRGNLTLTPAEIVYLEDTSKPVSQRRALLQKATDNIAREPDNQEAVPV